jgi:hypothetical protein
MNIKNTKLYRKVISRSNIYSAIYCIDSYIFEKGLLSDSDLELLNALSDKFNFSVIERVMKLCEKLIEKIFTTDNLFEITAYYKPKKYNEEKTVEYRPIHTADLITQICFVCMLNQIMFDDSDGKERKLSDVSKLLPSNFYGNIPSTNIESLFINWKTKYTEYSEAFIGAYKKYSMTGKYKYEICLDLVKFFPLINPNIVYNIIINKLSTIFIDSEMRCLEILVKKLLYFKMVNIEESMEIYYKNYLKSPDLINIIIDNNLFYSIGVPQGLPQAYFFANLCMIDIAKIFETKFKGDSYFYVDDSVIYTNDIEHSIELPDIFKDLLNKINIEINNTFEEKYLRSKPRDLLYIEQFNSLINYKIEVHETGKSSISKIDSKKYGLGYLEFVAKQASILPFEILSSSDEFEDSTVREKILVFKEAIDKEINLIKEKISDKTNSDSIDNYLKLLKRYKKFFKYRLKIMNLREDNQITNIDLKKFYSKYYLNSVGEKLSKNTIEKLFELMEEDILIPEAQLLIRQLSKNRNKQLKIINKIRNLEKKISQNRITNHLYITKVLESCLILEKLKNLRYESLELLVQEKIETYTRVNLEKQIKEIKKILNKIQICEFSENGLSMWFTDYLNINKKYIKFVYIASSEYKRILLNAVLSKIMSVQINDSCNILRIDSRPLRYYQLRILIYIRNLSFDIKKFVLFSDKVFNEIDKRLCSEKIDFPILEVLPLFKRYLRDADNIDELILSHKYVNGIWKNGSKFLHFYTMHNEEHSVELINRCLDIIKSIDYYQLKEMDYFILFLACYLHDVSMVLYPDLDRFSEETSDTDEIYSQWKRDFTAKIRDIEISPKSTIKKFIKDYYEIVNSYFEKNIRENHSKLSANFIKNTNDLHFLSEIVKAYVSDVSEAHGYHSKDVYGLRSNAKNDIVSDKYLMIILRLADLLDMSKDRVSLNILRQNIKNMPDVSKIHWISHLAIDRCEVHTYYKLICDTENNIKSYLDKEHFIETFWIDIYLNTKQLTSMDSNGCKHIKSTMKDKKIVIEIIDDANYICQESCCFLCKWMTMKNRYLFNELYELQKYLSRNKNNKFNTRIAINLRYNDATSIPGEYLDIVKNELNNI